ncbi:MAG: 50S ribosomal protein L30 [bacterium]|jgi:large subunit ribosomal protein L30
MTQKIQVTQIRSGIGSTRKQKECLKGLGLRKINHSVVLSSDPSILGMVRKVSHLVKVDIAE